MSDFAKMLQERRLARMRMGQEAMEIVDIPSDPEMRVALVPLLEKEMEASIASAAALNVNGGDPVASSILRDRHRLLHDMWQSARLVEDPNIKAFDSTMEMAETLEDVDINVLSERYLLMRDFASPAIDGLSEDDLAELKKGLMTIQWNELSGRQWAAVRLCLSVLLPDLLLAKLRGSTSTSSSTPMNEGETLTRTADQD